MRPQIGCGQFSRPEPGRYSLEFHGAAGHYTQSIDELLCRKHPGLVVRKISPVVPVKLIGLRRCLIRVAIKNNPEKVSAIITALTEILCECIQQGRITGRVGISEIIKGLNDSFTKKVGPDSVGLNLGKERVVLPRQPFSKYVPSIEGFFYFHFACLRRPRLHCFSGCWVRNLSVLPAVNDQFFTLACLFALHAVKECGKPIVVVLGPALKGVIVTLCALNS